METGLDKKVRSLNFRSLFSKKKLIICARIIVAVIMLLIIMKWVDLREAIKSISQVDMRYVLLIYILIFFDRYLMAYKWNKLLKLKGIVLSNAEAFRIYLGAAFAGTFLPNVVGSDVLRAIR